MLSFFPRDVLDEILDLIESVSEGFPTYSFELLGVILDPKLTFQKHIGNIVELNWLKHLWNHKNMFETGVVQANEC